MIPGSFMTRGIQLANRFTLLSTFTNNARFQLVNRVSKDMILINQHFLLCRLKRLFILIFQPEYKHATLSSIFPTVSPTPPVVAHEGITADTVLMVFNATSS